MKQKITRIMKLIRMREWLFSKIPFMFIPFLLYVVNHESIHGSGIWMLGISYFIFLFFFYSFGYAINDYSDCAIDQLVGKTNIMAEMSETRRKGVLLILIMGCIPFVLCTYSIKTILIFVFVYFWGAAYSVEPFRFKEKGAAGLLVSSLAQRTIPLLPLLTVSSEIYKYVAIWGTLGFFIGMRYILIHQSIDLENDRKSGTTTFADKNSAKIKTMTYLTFVAETLVLFAFFAVEASPGWLWGFLILYTIQELLSFYTVFFIYKESFLLSYICVPLEDFYNFYYPILLLLVLSKRTVLCIFPILFLLAIGLGQMIEKWKIPLFGLKHLKILGK